MLEIEIKTILENFPTISLQYKRLGKSTLNNFPKDMGEWSLKT